MNLFKYKEYKKSFWFSVHLIYFLTYLLLGFLILTLTIQTLNLSYILFGLFVFLIFMFLNYFILNDVNKKYYITEESLVQKSYFGIKEIKYKDIVEIYNEFLIWSGCAYRIKDKKGKKIWIREGVKGVNEILEKLQKETGITNIRTGL